MTVLYKDSDPATDHLLDFIAGGVPTNEYGESKGCYDATFGDIDGSVHGDLSCKTIKQIYSMQDEMLASNGISTATGRYQALKGTLQEYVKRSGLSDDELFTEEIQDDFGLTKMVDRGYQSWWKKQISDDELMHRLSCEWASLPDPYNDGKSHYDGDSAGNHASTTLAHFHEAVVQTRKYIDEQGDQLKPPKPEIIGAIEDPVQGIKAIQRILVLTGDLDGFADCDGRWGAKSEAAMTALINRSTEV